MNVISVFDNRTVSMFLLRRVSQPAISSGSEGAIRFSNTIRMFVTNDFSEVHDRNAHLLTVPFNNLCPDSARTLKKTLT